MDPFKIVEARIRSGKPWLPNASMKKSINVIGTKQRDIGLHLKKKESTSRNAM